MAVDGGERVQGYGAEYEHLRRDLAEAREQLAATSQVLTAVGRSAPDLDAALDTARRQGPTAGPDLGCPRRRATSSRPYWWIEYAGRPHISRSKEGSVGGPQVLVIEDNETRQVRAFLDGKEPDG